MKRYNLLSLPMALLIALLGRASAAPPYVDWAQLRGLNYKTGRINADTKALDGTDVKMAGFMVPFDDDQRQVSEFLLVGVAGACVHVPPPPPNQIVLVQMPAGKKASVFWQQPVWVVGKLRIEKADSPYGAVSYRMTGYSVELAKEFM